MPPMDLNAIPLFAMLRGKLGYDTQRQRVIAENVANADVPGYAPKDLKGYSFAQTVQQVGDIGLTPVARTSEGHMDLGVARPPPTATLSASATVTPDSETRLDGNRVVLEEQMVKLTEARMDYDAVVGFYQQSLGLLKMALQKPGAG